MKRYHGVWIAIVIIIITGIGTTGAMKYFVNYRATVQATEEVLPTEGYLKSAEESASADGTEPFSGGADAGSEALPHSSPETTLAIPPVPLTGEAVLTETEAPAEEKVYYIKYLEELDKQIAANRSLSKDGGANTRKANAESELWLWERELETIAEILSAGLGSEQYESFLAEQRSWIKEREIQSMEVSKKHSGSALESVEYAVSLAEQTRARAYFLAEEYRQYLDSEKPAAR